MSEPVFIALDFRNDGKAETNAATITSLQDRRDPVRQVLTRSELKQFGDNLTLLWEGEFDGEGYDLIRPISQREADAMPYRCRERRTCSNEPP